MLDLMTVKHAELRIGDVLHLSGDVLLDDPRSWGTDRVWIDVVSLEPPVIGIRKTGGPRWLEAPGAAEVQVERPADGDLPYSAPGEHVERGGVPAAEAEDDDIIARLGEWHRAGSRSCMPESLVAGVIRRDIALAAFYAACRWINGQTWADDDPDRIAAERMTVDEVIACTFQHYPHGERPWAHLFASAASLA